MKKIAIWGSILFIFSLTIAYLLLVPYYSFVTKTLGISPIKTLIDSRLLKTYNDQVNILLLGIAGAEHDGPNLSDSIIVVNYNLGSNKITTISIPRDIWSPTLRDKINSAYAYGEAKRQGKGGFILAKSEISEVVGFPIQYAAAIEYERFKDLIDYLDGIEVEVVRSFTDNKFPIKGRENDDCNGDEEYLCRYEKISFTKGVTKMDGTTASKFMRSRNSEGPEGSDFAREARQQKVMTAVKEKIIEYIKRPGVDRYSRLYSLFDSLVKRDLTNQQAASLIKNVVFKGSPSIKQVALTEDFFINPAISSEYDYRWTLVPKDGDFKQIHDYIKCELESNKKCKK